MVPVFSVNIHLLGNKENQSFACSLSFKVVNSYDWNWRIWKLAVVFLWLLSSSKVKFSVLSFLGVIFCLDIRRSVWISFCSQIFSVTSICFLLYYCAHESHTYCFIDKNNQACGHKTFVLLPSSLCSLFPTFLCCCCALVFMWKCLFLWFSSFFLICIFFCFLCHGVLAILIFLKLGGSTHHIPVLISLNKCSLASGQLLLFKMLGHHVCWESL